MNCRRPLSSSRRAGSLFLEAGIVVVLVSVFLVVLIPHFLRARGAARRTQCLNHLKNISLALQNYQEAMGVFPPGYVARNVELGDPAEKENGPGWGWAAMLLPQMEQSSLYQSFDFRLDIPGSPTMINTYLCPDDGAAPFSVNSPTAGTVLLSPTNYVAVAGACNLILEPGRPTNPGMFYRNSSIRLDHLLDGSSNTLMVGERRHAFDSPHGGLFDTGSTWLGAVSGVFRDAGHPDEPCFGGPGSLTLGIVAQPQPAPLQIPPNGNPAGLGFTSPHPGGVHFARADGSCAFMSEKIDPATFVRLGQIADSAPPHWP